MKSLAVKYRPTTFEEVAGQSITTKILNKVLEKQSFKNAYLFAGPSGCGKTTLARIFAMAINSGIGEPEELDAAYEKFLSFRTFSKSYMKKNEEAYARI